MPDDAEHCIEEKVCDWARSRGILPIKFTPKGEVGWPDHIFTVPPLGTTVWVEFKAPGEEPEPIQAYRIDEINKRGGNAYWVDSIDQGTEILLGHLLADEPQI